LKARKCFLIKAALIYRLTAKDAKSAKNFAVVFQTRIS